MNRAKFMDLLYAERRADAGVALDIKAQVDEVAKQDLPVSPDLIEKVGYYKGKFAAINQMLCELGDRNTFDELSYYDALQAIIEG